MYLEAEITFMQKAQKTKFITRPLKSVTAIPIMHDYFKSFDGTRIFFTVEGKGKALVFLHGLVCSNLHWHYQIESFRYGYKTIWFDYRGHKASQIPFDPENLSIHAIAKDLHLMLDTLGIHEVVLIGHSMGVNIALEAFKIQPGRIKALILSNGTLYKPLEGLLGTNLFQYAFIGFQKIFNKNPKLFRFLWRFQKQNMFMKLLITYAGFNPFLADPKDIEQYIHQALEVDPSVFFRLLEDYQQLDATHYLRQIHVPTLVIAGGKDKVTPLVQQELIHELIPHSMLEIIRHGSHCPQLDLPDLVSSKIQDFLKKIHYG